MTHINLEDFINNKRRCTISYGDKTWIFEEPTIEEILNVKDKADGTELARKMLKEGNIEDFELVCNQMTPDAKEALFKQILEGVGLSGRLQKASQTAS